MNSFKQIVDDIYSQSGNIQIIRDLILGISQSIILGIFGLIIKKLGEKYRNVILVRNFLILKGMRKREWLIKNIVCLLYAAFSCIIYIIIFFISIFIVTFFFLINDGTMIYKVGAVIVITIGVGTLFHLYRCTELKAKVVYPLFVFCFLFLYFKSSISLHKRIMVGANIYMGCLVIVLTYLLMKYYKKKICDKKIQGWLIVNCVWVLITIWQIQVNFFNCKGYALQISFWEPLITSIVWLRILRIQYVVESQYTLVTTDGIEREIYSCKKCKGGFCECSLGNRREKLYIKMEDIKYIICSIDKKSNIEKEIRLRQEKSRVILIDGSVVVPYYCSIPQKDFVILYFAEDDYDKMYYVNKSQISNFYIKK